MKITAMSFNTNNPEPVKHSMQLDEDIPFFKKEVIFQRIGWVMMFLLLVLGLSGLFGTGMLSNKEERTANASVQFERFMRFENETDLVFLAGNTSGSTTISLPHAYIRRFSVERITPEPERTTQDQGRITYFFEATGPTEVKISVKPRQTGRSEATVLVNNDVFTLSHFVYP